jgi:monoamine oxidase
MLWDFNPFRRGMTLITDVKDEAEATENLFSYRDFELGNVPATVCIVGGGISGLTAAYELSRLAEKAGKPIAVDLLEQTGRLGGRILTHYFDTSKQDYAELGPMRLPSYHKLAHHYLDKFGLETYAFSGNRDYHLTRFPNSYPKQNDRRLSEYEAATLLLNSYTNPEANRFFRRLMSESARLDSIKIDLIEDKFVEVASQIREPDLSALLYSDYGHREAKGHRRRWELFQNYPTTIWGRTIEGLSVREGFELFVRNELRKARNQGDANLAGWSPHDLGKLVESIWESVGQTTGLVWLEHISLGHFLREVTALSAKQKFAIAGGFQRLVDAFAESLRRESRVSLETRCTVDRIELGHDHVTVCWDQLGCRQSKTYERVICTIPAPAVLRIDFTPQLPFEQRSALASISYLSASKSAAYFKRRFWEADLDPIKVGGVTYTDLPIQQIWYPNDNALPDENDAQTESGPRDTPTLSRANIPIATRRRDDQRSNGPGAIVAAYMWGDNSKRFASLPDDQKDRLIRECLERIYPGCSKYLVDLKHWPWDAQSNPGGGAFAWYRPGQQARYQAAASRAHRTRANGPNQVCFAGEHLGLIQGWIQGAMQTAISAVGDVCN